MLFLLTMIGLCFALYYVFRTIQAEKKVSEEKGRRETLLTELRYAYLHKENDELEKKVKSILEENE